MNKTQYINAKTNFNKFSKAQLVSMMEQVMQYMENNRHRQLTFELASHLKNELGEEQGILNPMFENEFSENYYDADRSMQDAFLSVQSAKNECGEFGDAARHAAKEILEMLK